MIDYSSSSCFLFCFTGNAGFSSSSFYTHQSFICIFGATIQRPLAGAPGNMIQVYVLSRLGAIALAAPLFWVKKDPIRSWYGTFNWFVSFPFFFWSWLHSFLDILGSKVLRRYYIGSDKGSVG